MRSGNHLLQLAAVLLLAAGSVSAQVVIDEDFEGADIDGTLLGTAPAQLLDLADGRSQVLSLTQGINGQTGFAWFNEPFNLRDNKVTIDFDFWIRTGSSFPPADGMSIIFQFGNNTSATGGGGGGLGTGNFPTDYVSVGFDIWDNRETNDAIDPNHEPCYDATNTRACHVEVNQNITPGTQPSLATSANNGVPDFIAVGDTFEPIRASIVFDNGEIKVFLQTDSDLAEDFADPVLVIQAVLADFPEDANAIVGFGASTGGANAHHEVDNLVVEIDEPTPRISVTQRLGDGTRGAINCGSATEVTGTVNDQTYTFVADTTYGQFLFADDSGVPIEDTFAGFGHDGIGNPAGPTNLVTNLDAADPLQNMYQTERWNNGAVYYKFDVDPGRYEVNLHFNEGNPGSGIGAAGEPTRIIHAWLEEERALAHFSAADAAGEEQGTGPIPDAAVVRTFQVDADETLEVVISDIGWGTTPPENAQINGISYRRLGDASGTDLDGFEYRGPVTLPEVSETELVVEDFDGQDLGFCPESWICNSAGGFDPQVVDLSDAFLGIGINPRLRLTSNAGSLGTTVFYDEPVDLSANGFKAEFDVFLTASPPTARADGMTFLFAPLADPMGAVGAVGGGMGYSGLTTGGFAIEFDNYLGGGANEPNGANPNQGGVGHIGLLVNGSMDNQTTDVLLDRRLSAHPGWPIQVISDPGGPDDLQYTIGTEDLENDEAAGMHVEVSLNNGRLQTWVETVNTDEDAGAVMPRTLVIDTLLDYTVTGLGEGYFGFSAGTGGAVTWHEVDNVSIVLTDNQDVFVTRSVDSTTFSDASTPIGVTLDIAVDAGTGPHAIAIAEQLPADWTATGISNGGSFDAGSGIVSWDLNGVSADTSVSYQAVPGGGSTEDQALSGTFNADATADIPIGTVLLLYQPPEFCRDGASEELIIEDFDDYADGECPAGTSCNTNSVGFNVFEPHVTQEAGHEGRLRLTEQTGNLGTSVIWEDSIDLTQNSFTAEFDAYFSVASGTPADGMVFVIVDATQQGTDALGAGGGALGYAGDANANGTGPISGLAIELDIYQGAGDPSGYNTTGFGHVGLIRDGIVVTHAQTNVDLDPNLIPEAAGGDGFPYFVDVGPDATGFPLHVRVDYNNGRIRVWLSADETTDAVGNIEPEFEETLVIDSVVKFPGAGQEFPVLQEAYVGFCAGTGGSVADQEIDDFTVTTYERSGTGNCDGGLQFRRGDPDNTGGGNITDAIAVLNHLFAGAPRPVCWAAADANADGGVNVSDPVYQLNFLFGGGPATPPPGPVDCGPGTPEDEALGCDTYTSC